MTAARRKEPARWRLNPDEVEVYNTAGSMLVGKNKADEYATFTLRHIPTGISVDGQTPRGADRDDRRVRDKLLKEMFDQLEDRVGEFRKRFMQGAPRARSPQLASFRGGAGAGTRLRPAKARTKPKKKSVKAGAKKKTR